MTVSKHFTLPAHADALYPGARVATGVSGWDAVGDEQVRAFHEDGYFVLHDAFDAAAVQAAHDGLDHLIDGGVPAYGGVQFEAVAPAELAALPVPARRDYVRKLMGMCGHEPRLEAVAQDPRLLALLARLFGEPPVIFQEMALLKPAGVGSEKPWHQDNAYFDIEPASLVIGVWVALDEALAENGCMHLIPGSHRRGPHPHFQRRDWQLCDTDIPVADDVVVPLAPGGALIFQGLLFHGTPANRSPLRRRALQFHYCGQSVQRVSQEARLAAFGSEGRGVSC